MNIDFRALWMGRMRRKVDVAEGLISSLRNRASALLWGIVVGRGCLFFGRVSFRRTERSKISIGSRCVFRSSTRSNFAGMNRPCMISTLSEGAIVRIGSGCGFSGTVIGAAESIIIGDNVLCGINVTITDTDWHRVEPDLREEMGASAPVIIEDNVWIGMNSIVLKGVTIGKNSVVGAGSIVTKSIPANMIAFGSPAVAVRGLGHSSLHKR